MGERRTKGHTMDMKTNFRILEDISENIVQEDAPEVQV
jgi:hypothetical protein